VGTHRADGVLLRIDRGSRDHIVCVWGGAFSDVFDVFGCASRVVWV